MASLPSPVQWPDLLPSSREFGSELNLHERPSCTHVEISHDCVYIGIVLSLNTEVHVTCGVLTTNDIGLGDSTQTQAIKQAHLTLTV